MFLHCVSYMGLTIFSFIVSAHVLVCGRTSSESALFVLALGLCIVMLASIVEAR